MLTTRKNIKKEKLEHALNKLQRVYKRTPEYPRVDRPWDNTYRAMLRAKIKKLKLEIEEASKRIHYEGFYIKKMGDATVALAGFPSAGKSSLLNAIASTRSKTAAYAFTTTSIIPGTMVYRDSHIQIFDMPGLIEGAHIGRGRGPMVIAGMRVADLLLFIIDINMLYQFEALINEFSALSIEINKPRPHFSIIDQASGGIRIVVNHSGLPDKLIKEILGGFGINNATFSIWSMVDEDELIALLAGKAYYMRAIVALNKIDTVKEYQKISDAFAKKYDITTVPISATKYTNLEMLKEKIYENLNIITVYLKHRMDNEKPMPLTLKKGATVADAAKRLHTDISDTLKCAIINGQSVKFPNQKVGSEHVLMDGDLVTLIQNK